MNKVIKGRITDVKDDLGNVKTYYEGEILPESFQVPEDYYTNKIVEKTEKEKSEIKQIKIKKEQEGNYGT
jgi:hypothetical protein